MIRQHHSIKAVFALSAITAALLIAGCGGSSSSGKADGVHTVRAAFVSPHGPGYQVALKVTGNAAGHTLNVTGTGVFDQAAHAWRLTVNVNPPTAGSENLQINEVILGNDFYMKLPASLTGDVPGGKPWLELNLSDIRKSAGIQGLSSLADNPGENLAEFPRLLRADSIGGVHSRGRRTIDGVSTTGLDATFDLSKVAATLPAYERQSAASAIASIEKLTGLRYLPAEAWVDSSHHLRRIVVTATGHVYGQPFSENIQLDFVKYGLEPVPTAPPPADVANITSEYGTH